MILFARHGETQFNKEGRLQGVSDSPLTGRGLQQAIQLKKIAEENNVTEIITSPLLRVVQTAKVVSNDFVLKNVLREISYGEWEERKKEDLKKLPLWKKRQKDRFNFRHPGNFNGIKGEGYKDLYKRLIPFFKKLREEKNNLLILSHVGVLRCACKYYNNLSDEETSALEFKNDTVLVLENGRVHEYSESL